MKIKYGLRGWVYLVLGQGKARAAGRSFQVHRDRSQRTRGCRLRYPRLWTSRSPCCCVECVFHTGAEVIVTCLPHKLTLWVIEERGMVSALDTCGWWAHSHYQAEHIWPHLFFWKFESRRFWNSLLSLCLYFQMEKQD